MWCGVFLLGQKTRWTFSKGKCDAEHFTKSNVMLNILQSQMYAKMHFCIKCIFAQLNIFQRKMFSKTKCTHQMHLMPKCILAYIWLCKMFSNAVQKCIWCKNAFLRTFSKGKCSASHFPKENVQHQQNVMQKCIFAQHLCFLQSKKHSIFALPLFFAAQKTQQHQTHFCTKTQLCATR